MERAIDYYQLITIGLLWLAYFVIHSIAASLTAKRWVAGHFSRFMPAYRLSFNILASILIVPILSLSIYWSSEPLWRWSSPLMWVTSIISVITIIAFYFSLRYYDMKEFMGTRQWSERNARVEDQEQFVIGEFHRFVRHPWYTMAIVLIWCRELDPVMLTNAIMLTLYFIVGSRLEERKLTLYHGDVYRQYCKKVPALVPRPWRFLSKTQVKKLLSITDNN